MMKIRCRTCGNIGYSAASYGLVCKCGGSFRGDTMMIKSKSVPIIEKCSIIKDTMKTKPKLLVVDDELDQREFIKNYFSRRNFLVLSAPSAEEALALIKKDKPDLILLDMRLKGDLEGKDLLRALRNFDKETEVIMITGDTLTHQEMQEVTALGIVDFLHKPVDIKILESIIKKALEHSYPKAVYFEQLSAKTPATPDTSLRGLTHSLANITSDIVSKCELYLLDTEEGLNKDKSEKERLEESINILKSILKSTERLTDLIQKFSTLTKQG